MNIKVLHIGSCLQLPLGCIGLSRPLLKRIEKVLSSSRWGITLVVTLLVLCGQSNALIYYKVANPHIQFKQARFISWDTLVREDGIKDRIIISGTFFDIKTRNLAFAKYTRDLNGFYGVTLVHKGEILYHPRQQGFETLDLNSFVSRLAVGYLKDGSLIVGQSKCPLVWMAYYMKALGCIEAVGLDGGSSVGIWKNKTIIKPGRSLNNVYFINN